MSVDGTYRANAFAPETGTRVNSGTLRILADRVEFSGGMITGSLPLSGLRLRRGGHNDEHIFFEHSNHPGWSIYSSDEALLKDPVLANQPEFRTVLRSVERARRSLPPPVYIGIGVAAIVLGFLAALWLAKDHIAEYIADKIPLSWEEKLGEQVFQQVAAQGKIVTNSAWQGTVTGITQRLLPAVSDSGYNFRFHIMQDTNVNAFAIPGGHVVILTGLLERADSAEEVAGVLAHELAHVTRRHSLRNMVKSAGVVILIQAALGDASGLMAIAIEGSRFLLQQKFSRDFEREADDTGWNYLVETRTDPRGMIRFFEKMKQMVAQSAMGAMEGSLSWLNTHPASQERIDRLKAKWEALPAKNGFIPLEPLKNETR
jgi:beta-barrel assembly-enhancing protease